jgi:hypothetical protein
MKLRDIIPAAEVKARFGNDRRCGANHHPAGSVWLAGRTFQRNSGSSGKGME